MEQNKSARIWQWAVLLLVLCNIGLIVTIWLRPLQQGPPGRETPRDYVIRNLKFNAQQVQKYDVLVAAHQDAMKHLRADAGTYRDLLFTNLKYPGGGSNTDSLAQLIANNQKQVELVTYSHFAAVRALCTEPQKATFDNIITDVIKKMNGGPHNGPPPGEGRPPRDGGPPPPREGPPPNGQ